MNRARAFVAVALLLLFFGFSFNAYACLIPLYGGASTGKGSDCSAPDEQSARQFCDAFKTLAVHTPPDLEPASDSPAFCPQHAASLSQLLNLPTRSMVSSDHGGDRAPQDLRVKSSVLRL